MARWRVRNLTLLLAAAAAARACASLDAQLPSARPAAASIRDPEADDAGALALEAAEAEAARLLHDTLFLPELESAIEMEIEDEDEDSSVDESDGASGRNEDHSADEYEAAGTGNDDEKEEGDAREEAPEAVAGIAGQSEQHPLPPRAAPARLKVRRVIFPDASIVSRSEGERAAHGASVAGDQQATDTATSEDVVHESSARLHGGSAEQLDTIGESVASKQEKSDVASNGRKVSLGSSNSDEHENGLGNEDVEDTNEEENDGDIAGLPLSSSVDGNDVVVADDAAAVDVDDAICPASSTIDGNSCTTHPLKNDAGASTEGDKTMAAVSSSSEDAMDAAVRTQDNASHSAFQDVVQDLAAATEQIVLALREGRLPHSPHSLVALSSVLDSTREGVGASAKSALKFATSVIDVCYEYLVRARAKLSVLLDASLELVSAYGDVLASTLHTWSEHVRSAFRELSAWCWELWATYEEVRVAVRNLHALALLALCGLLFFAVYRVAAAIPELLCSYLLSFDDVTRAQLKIFSVVLALVVVYHARMLAWFWLLALAALGYYYWSGHVVISIEFK